MTTAPQPELGEAFLHYIWQQMAFDWQDLQTTRGEPVQIIHVGVHNARNAGADFAHARIYINGILWVGDVELHWRASEWRQHGHADDAAYERVVLHVVHTADTEILRADGLPLPTLALSGRIPAHLAEEYRRLSQSRQWLPCAAHQPDVFRSLDLRPWLAQMGIERLESKMQSIAEQLEATQQNWNEVMYWQIAQALGADVNGAAMLALAQSIPLLTIVKQRQSLTQLEALFFGQASLLPEESEEPYVQELKREYAHLRAKYQLQPISRVHWRFSRLRPAHFPTLRVAQLAQLFFQSDYLFSRLLNAQNLRDTRLFLQIRLHSFWDTHYRLEKPSKTAQAKTLGNSAIDALIINALAPMLYAKGTFRLQSQFCTRTLAFLSGLEAEENHYTRQWTEWEVAPNSALESQGLLHWHKQYCSQHRCLECPAGKRILRHK